ncbi:alpha-glucosidase [Oligoflexia bacterium]|nr:alpha-glucosidase [Oligoflexia bacterium]
MRIIPPILEICQDIKALCPDAYIFNHSNPMSRICTAVHHRYPELNFIGLCHEIASLERYLPQMLGVTFSDLELTAGGLNHFSCLLEARYRTSGRDAYPDIRKKALSFFEHVPASADYFAHMLETGHKVDTEGARTVDLTLVKAARQWTERTLFNFILENFNLLPITTDSHFGEYLGWGYDIADHKGILDFYRYYRSYLAAEQPEIKLELDERAIPIIEGIIADTGYVEAAVNIPNRGYIQELPENIAVEVPATVSKKGVTGLQLAPLPPAYAGLLQNQVAVHNMTVEAVLTKSKQAVVQALLVDPVVDQARCLPELVDVMIDLQRPYLGYIENA